MDSHDAAPPAAGEPAGLQIEPRLLQREVLKRLRQEIVDGIWGPGDRLNERVLCERFGVSRSPLREAYQVLAREGWIDLLPNRGAVVSVPDAARTLERLDVIIALETMAIRIACTRATMDDLDRLDAINHALAERGEAGDKAGLHELNNRLHNGIVALSGNRTLIDMHADLARHFTRAQRIAGDLADAGHTVHDEHARFLSAMRDRDPDEADEQLRRHLRTVRRKVMASYRGPSD